MFAFVSTGMMARLRFIILWENKGNISVGLQRAEIEPIEKLSYEAKTPLRRSSDLQAWASLG